MCVITNLLSLLVKLPDQVCDSQKKFRSRATWTREVQQRNQQTGNIIIEKWAEVHLVFCFVLFCFIFSHSNSAVFFFLWLLDTSFNIAYL